MSKDYENYPFGDPSSEFMQYKGLDKPRYIEMLEEVDNRDILMAILRSADTMWFELRRIREAMEKK